jgi:hypothetical protein
LGEYSPNLVTLPVLFRASFFLLLRVSLFARPFLGAKLIDFAKQEIPFFVITFFWLFIIFFGPGQLRKQKQSSVAVFLLFLSLNKNRTTQTVLLQVEVSTIM